MYHIRSTFLLTRNPEGIVEKNEEEEFAKGPLSILYQAVKNNTAVYNVSLLFNA